MRVLRLNPLLAVLLLSLAGSFFGCSDESKRARYLKRADEYYAKGNFIEADIEYRNVIRLSETLDPHVVGRLANMCYEQGRILESFSLFTNAVALKPTDMDLRYRLGTVFIALQQPNAAREQALTVLTNQPAHAEAMLLLTDAARTPEEIGAARKKINELAGVAGDRWSVHIALAELAFREKQTNVARAEIQKAAQLDAKNPHVNVALAKLAANGNQPQEVERFLQLAAENSPKRSPHRLLLPQYKLERTNSAEAKLLLDKIIKDTPDYVPAASLRGRIAIAEKDYEESARLAKSVLAWDPLNYEIRLMNARTLTLQKKNANAIVEFERLLSLYPQVPELHYEAAVAYVQNGSMNEALKELDEALRLNRDYADAAILRAEIKMRNGAPESAVIDLVAFTRSHPENARAFLTLADAYRTIEKYDEALKIYQAFIKQNPTSAEFPFAAGSILLQQKKFDEARPYFEQALARFPAYVMAAEQLVDLDLRNKNFEGAQRRVQEQLRLTTNAPAALMLEAKVCFARKDWSCAESALTRVIQAEPDTMAPYSLLANVYLGAGSQQKALAQLQSAIDRNPKDATAHLMTGVIYEAQKNYSGAKKAYEGALKANPNMSAALNNLAYMLSERLNQVDEALPLAIKAHELAPRDFGATDTLGWIYYRRGETLKALPLLRESALQLPKQREVQLHLAMAQYSMGDEVAARAGFNKVMQLDKALADAKGVPQKLALLDIDPSSANAVAALESAVKQDNKDYIATLKLGRAYEHTGANDKARATLERAVRLNPGSPQAQIALASVHNKLNDVPNALAAGRVARKLSPNDPMIAGVLGRISYRAHDYFGALALLQEYVRAEKADPEAWYDLALANYGAGQFAEARASLDNYIKAGKGTRLTDARNLTALLDFYAGKGDAGQSASIATARLERDRDDIPGLVTSGLVAQRSGKFADAAQQFERVVTLNKSFPVAQRQLAILYAEHLKNDQKAYDYGSKARQTFVNDPELAIAMGKAGYRRNDFQTAVRLLDEGVKQRQTDAEAFFYLGMAYHKLGKSTEAKTGLTRAVSAKLDPSLAAEANKVLASLK